MPTVRKIGTFELTSPTVLVSDPVYSKVDIVGGSCGCTIKNCSTGTWHLELTEEIPPSRKWPVPKITTAYRQGHKPSKSTKWRCVKRRVGQDTAQIGIFDGAHYEDEGVIPPNQKWTFDDKPAVEELMWYSFICEMARSGLAVVVPYGAVACWDGVMRVEAYKSDGEVVAVRLSITGWPDEI